MGENLDDAMFSLHKDGWNIDTDELVGKKITNEQAKIIVMQNLADSLNGLASSAADLAAALSKTSGY
jgi:hypothetical protein